MKFSDDIKINVNQIVISSYKDHDENEGNNNYANSITILGGNGLKMVN